MIAQLARFGVVGVAAMCVHWLVVRLLVPAGMAPLLANVVGFGVAFNISYFGHRNWTFASDSAHRATFWRFLTVALTSFALNEALYSVLLQFMDYSLALAIVLVAVSVLTFILSKLWAFRHPPQPSISPDQSSVE
ncbi:MAG: GtrA family protein [Spongiibacteraceae bacterium]